MGFGIPLACVALMMLGELLTGTGATETIALILDETEASLSGANYVFT